MLPKRYKKTAIRLQAQYSYYSESKMTLHYVEIMLLSLKLPSQLISIKQECVLFWSLMQSEVH